MTWISLVLGAAIGAPLRYLVDRWVTERTTSSSAPGLFPWGLFTVNVTGSAAAGVIVAVATGDLRVLLLTGFCGAFTTFSGFAWEVDRLWELARVNFWWAITVTPVACVATFLLAWRLSGVVAA